MELLLIISVILALIFCFIGIPLISICLSKKTEEQENLV